ncbi:DUF4160 domain-containing protein [Desulfosporosinus sp. PR]|uniref:DUF4160 domain-containing protein n=1 Tax=Candidatus Desulfosporosinus nitrosoreducens TaxID=3401928 RepID=UPI0027EC9B78|nr:DUF4160 domain-containing protein [Desulfosporosinus sp. PR]MDQ7095032.1 DUF4160 domain-containing protein [Desulfosporosinus sp. PR]
MPSLFRIGEYLVYFWSNENNEPIHVHIGKGKPNANATKVWWGRVQLKPRCSALAERVHCN